MARKARDSRGGVLYHVLNRGMQGAAAFYLDEDYASFVRLMLAAHERVPMRLVGYCLLPNHFHLVLWPYEDGDLSRWVQWVLTEYVRRYHRYYQSNGYIWHGRFKAFPIQQDEHSLEVLRYVERNPLRANLVERSQDWEWSSLKPTSRSVPVGLLSDGPVVKPPQWTRIVNKEDDEAGLTALRQSVVSGAPFGDPEWRSATAKLLGVPASSRRRYPPRGTF